MQLFALAWLFEQETVHVGQTESWNPSSVRTGWESWGWSEEKILGDLMVPFQYLRLSVGKLGIDFLACH